MRGLRHATLVVAVVASSYTQAAAQDAALDAGSALTWRTSIKIAGLFSRTPVDPELFPQRNSAESLWRITRWGARHRVEQARHVLWRQRSRLAGPPDDQPRAGAPRPPR